MKTIKQLLVEIHGSGHIGCVITDEEIEAVKSWALEMVSEDENVVDFSKSLAKNSRTRNQLRKEIRNRIEK